MGNDDFSVRFVTRKKGSKNKKKRPDVRTSQCGDEKPLMAAVKPRAANPTVSVLSSLSANATRSTLNACTWGTCTPWLWPRATSPRRTCSPSSFCGFLVFSENARYTRVSRSRVGRRNDAKRLEKVYELFDDDEKRREKKREEGSFPRARGTARSWPGYFLFDSADGHPHCASVEGARFSSQPPKKSRGEARGRRTAVFTL